MKLSNQTGAEIVVLTKTTVLSRIMFLWKYKLHALWKRATFSFVKSIILLLSYIQFKRGLNTWSNENLDTLAIWTVHSFLCYLMYTINDTLNISNCCLCKIQTYPFLSSNELKCFIWGKMVVQDKPQAKMNNIALSYSF